MQLHVEFTCSPCLEDKCACKRRPSLSNQNRGLEVFFSGSFYPSCSCRIRNTKGNHHLLHVQIRRATAIGYFWTVLIMSWPSSMLSVSNWSLMTHELVPGGHCLSLLPSSSPNVVIRIYTSSKPAQDIGKWEEHSTNNECSFLHRSTREC